MNNFYLLAMPKCELWQNKGKKYVNFYKQAWLIFAILITVILCTVQPYKQDIFKGVNY